ncbi:reverse transcriptase family protein [Thalassospira sp. CH_XMU1448-2]|uniref:reverse transcriptase family protein n=1 Tax=Thalassospira sp. CH_XMU1448-2 TaxID=3107773 RepID=UPI003008DFAA
MAEAKAKGLSKETINAAVEQITALEDEIPPLPAILSLKHLSLRTGVSYNYLRNIVQREEKEAYRRFSIRKQSGGRRFIHVPDPWLCRTQKWIHEYILKPVPCHRSSHAFSPNSSILKCASKHSGAQWLVKMDVEGFFESISEIQVSRVFKELGYQPLVAFEMGRICTIRPGGRTSRWGDAAWRTIKSNIQIPAYNSALLGYLPQGAPTSPLLSNLVMREIDKCIQKICLNFDLTYTRYSDDLTFSSRDKAFTRKQARTFIHEINKILSKDGFRPQHRKTHIIPPGSRKIVLGLLVDGEGPRLRREFKDNLRQHLYYLEKHGSIEHAQRRAFDSVWGMKCHIRGLIDYANMIEPSYAAQLLQRFNKIAWPI